MPLQTSTPIIAALKKYIAAKPVRFHMPGHKGGRVLNTALDNLLGSRMFQADVTNIPGMDDLHQPHGAIMMAQQLAAKVFGAEHTYFLVNGSSCGLQALIMAVCNPGDKILVCRNVHRSILSGIILSGAIPVFYMPEYDTHYDIVLGTTPESIERSLARHGDVKAVLLVNPTYHGITSDIAAIAGIVRSRRIPLLVDEAHGPHLAFHRGLPAGSLSGGADAVVQGTHKMLAALTQASMLHLRSDLIDRRRLEAALKTLQSTSTSYLLLSSLDAARAKVEKAGEKLARQAIEVAAYARARIAELEELTTFGAEICGRPGVFGLDPTKVTVSLKKLPLTGFAFERQLRGDYNIQVEMADLTNVLLLITFGNVRRDVDRFVGAARAIIGKAKQASPQVIPARAREAPIFSRLPDLVMAPREAFFAPVVPVPLAAAVDRTSAEVIACYPPGIPVVCPGEKISGDVVDYLTGMRELGVHFQGCFDPRLKEISVIA
jgi:lysine decarboxylase